MQEKYRVRTGYRVQLSIADILELWETGGTVIEIDGQRVGFGIDMREVEHPEDVNRVLGMGEQDVERLFSGFPICYYSVIGDEDLTLMYEHRLDSEDIMVDRAGGFVEPDEFIERAPDNPVTEFRLSDVPHWYTDSEEETLTDHVSE